MNKTLRSIGPSEDSGLIAFGDSCCVGLDSNSQCVKSRDSCMSRFANRGWSLCCQIGYFYSAGTQGCVSDCQGGAALFGVVCLLGAKTLDLTGSRPLEGTPSMLCNGVTVSALLPVCCPAGFFITDNTGCQLCDGKIFTVIGYQICCSKQQYFNASSSSCRHCNGTIDASGQVCCPSGTYIKYDANGIPSCSAGCNLDNLYKTQFCC